MGISEMLKNVLLGYRARNIKEQTLKEGLISDYLSNEDESFLSKLLTTFEHHLSPSRDKHDKYLARLQAQSEVSRPHHYPEAFRIHMCETDIKAWLDRESNNDGKQRRLSQAFIAYLMAKYNLSHHDIMLASERVRYRIHG